MKKLPPGRSTAYNRDYGTCRRTCVVFSVLCGSMLVTEATNFLGIQPTDVAEKGKVVANSRGRIAPLNIWFIRSEGQVDSLDLRHHLDWLLDKIEPAASGIHQLQRLDGIVTRIMCIWESSVGHGGPTLWPEQMQRIANLNLELGFDIYFFGDDEDEPDSSGDPPVLVAPLSAGRQRLITPRSPKKTRV